MLENFLFEFSSYPVTTLIIVLVPGIIFLSILLLGAKQIQTGTANKLAVGIAVVLGISLEIVWLAWYSARTGEPVAAYLVQKDQEKRITTLYSRPYPGKNPYRYCRLRITAFPSGDLITQSEYYNLGGCEPIGGKGAVLWLRMYSKNHISSDQNAMAVDLYSGKILGALEDKLNDTEIVHKFPVPLRFERQAIDEKGAYDIRLPDNSIHKVRLDLPAESWQARIATTGVIWKQTQIEGYFRAYRLGSDDSVTNQFYRNMIFHSATAFGEGDWMLTRLNEANEPFWSFDYTQHAGDIRTFLMSFRDESTLYMLIKKSGYFGQKILHIIRLNSETGKLLSVASL